MPISTWIKDWNDIIRYVIFPDDELKRLMLLPEGTNIIDFIDHFFVRNGSNEVLEHEDVRINYANLTGEDTAAPNVRKSILSFDIYVRR